MAETLSEKNDVTPENFGNLSQWITYIDERKASFIRAKVIKEFLKELNGELEKFGKENWRMTLKNFMREEYYGELIIKLVGEELVK